jgi:hypothetical protein
MELAEALRSYRPRLRTLLVSLLAGITLAMVVVSAQVFEIVSTAVDMFKGDVATDFRWIMAAVAAMFLAVIIVALSSTVLIFIGQTRRFIALLRARYGILEGGPPSSRTRGEGVKSLPEGISPLARLNPARTLLGLAREAEGEMPQVDRLFRYATSFTFMLAGLLALEVPLVFLGYAVVPDGLAVVSTVTMTVAALVLWLAVVLLVEAQRFLLYFVTRVEALEAFEAQGPVPVPGGDSALDRFRHCLLMTHPARSPDEGPGELEGASGMAHTFGAVMGGLGSRVLVRTYDHVPRIEDVKELWHAADDVARRDGRLPRRVVALVTADLDELDVDDIVYDFLMEHPLEDKRGERVRSLQIVAEVEGRYSVLPFTAP